MPAKTVRAEPPSHPAPHPDDYGERKFEMTGFAAYRMLVAGASTIFEISRLRRSGGELFGELVVRCAVPGARTTKGVLSSADWNISGLRSRTDRAKHLASRSRAQEFDWEGWLNEFAQYIIDAERTGQPAELLTDITIPDDAGELHAVGLSLPKRDPAILFGDGGSAKSLLSLYTAGQFAHAGELVMYCDWEASGSDHHRRLRLLWPDHPPAILYARCERALVVEVDRLRALVKEHGITYLVLDSAAYGCHGAPEAAETAIDYFRALRSLGSVGSLLLAHTTKSEDGDKRPFGSSFWHNSARSTWHIKRSNPDDDSGSLQVLISQRKCNDGFLRAPRALSIDFRPDKVSVTPASVIDRPEFSEAISLPQRIREALKRGPMGADNLRTEVGDVKPDTFDRTVRRFVRDGKLLRIPTADGKELMALPHKGGQSVRTTPDTSGRTTDTDTPPL